MALNMDDLIGSMQHGFHAGDRGNDLNEIRESLKLSLGQQTPTSAGPSNAPQYPHQQQHLARRNPPFASQQQAASSLDADVAMLSSSSSSQQYQQQQYYAQQPSFFGASGGGPGSWGSQSSASSSNFGAPLGGWGYAPAPANTPQQTPVETSALARQLQAELERQSNTSTSPRYAHEPLSPTLSSGPAPPPPLHALQQKQGQQGDEPRSYVNGFAPRREDSSTPTGSSAVEGAFRGSMSPQLGNAPQGGGLGRLGHGQ